MANNPEPISNFKLLRHLISINLPPDEFKLAAILVVSHRNESTLQCSPSQRTLAKEYGLKPTNHGTIARIVAKLKQKGVLETVRTIVQNKPPFKLPTQYCFLFDLEQAIHWAENSNGSYKGTASTLDDYKCITVKIESQSHSNP